MVMVPVDRMARNSWILLAVLAAGLGGSLFAQDTGKTVRHHKEAVVDPSQAALTQAESAIEKKDYATAESSLKEIVQRDPNNYQAWFDLGFVYNALGKREDSVGAYRKSVAAKPDVFESNLNLGLMLARAGQPDAAQYLRAATKLTPADHVEEGRERAWLSLAHVLEASKPQEALEAYRQAAVVQPKDPEPHIAAGLLLERQNDLPAAEKEYQQVAALDPQSVEAMTALANIYMRAKRFPEAESTLRELAKQRPDDAGVHLQLGRVLAASGKTDEAIAELQAGLKLTPGDKEAQRDLAELFSSSGKYEQSEPLYRSLVSATPNDAELHQSLGKALMHEKKFGEAQQEFLAAIKLKPDLATAYGDLAAVANENKNYELVIKALDARAKLLPEIPVGYFLRATAYDHLRDYKQAAINYHQFLESAKGQFPDQEWQARHRLIAIQPKK
jgi:tetratricopeptide (TPR) repeat protein